MSRVDVDTGEFDSNPNALDRDAGDVEAKNENQNSGKNTKDEPETSRGDKLLRRHKKKTTRNRGTFRYMEFDKESVRKSNEAEQESEPHTWKWKLRAFLHSKPLHFAIIALTLIDVVLVMVELILDLRRAEACSGTSEGHSHNVGAEVVHYMSIAILSIFLVEIALKLIADWTHFWKHKVEIFDAIVVIVAFSFDIAVTFVGTAAFDAVGLLVLLRLWRVVRVINGIVLTASIESEQKAHELKHELEEKTKETEKLKEEIQKLKDILLHNNIHYEEDKATGSDVNSSSFTIDA